MQIPARAGPGYRRSAEDIPITPAQVRQYGLRAGDRIQGTAGGQQTRAQQAKTQQGKTQQGKAQQGKTQQGKAREDKTLLTVESVTGPPASTEAKQRARSSTT